MPDELLLLVEEVDWPPVLVELLPPNDDDPLVDDVDCPPVLVELLPPLVEPPNDDEPLVLEVPPPVEVEAELVAELPPLVEYPPLFPPLLE